MKNKILEEFDKEFHNSRGVFENNDPYNLRRNAIKSFLISSINQVLKEVIGNKIDTTDDKLYEKEFETVRANFQGLNIKRESIINKAKEMGFLEE